MRKELFYVAASRGRESVLVITSDKELLRESVAQSNVRQSASDLVRKVRPGLHQGMNRGFAAACKLVRWAAHNILQLNKSIALQGDLRHEPAIKRTCDRTAELDFDRS
jgi:hypothetical protein